MKEIFVADKNGDGSKEADEEQSEIDDDTKVRALSAKLNVLESELRETRQLCATRRTEVKQMTDKTNALEQQVLDLERAKAKLSEQASQYAGVVDQYKRQEQLLQQRVRAMERELDQREKRFRTSKGDVDKHEEHATRLAAQYDDMKKEHDQLLRDNRRNRTQLKQSSAARLSELNKQHAHFQHVRVLVSKQGETAAIVQSQRRLVNTAAASLESKSNGELSRIAGLLQAELPTFA